MDAGRRKPQITLTLRQLTLDLARELGDRNFQFEALQGLGRLHHAAGRPDLAVAHHQPALELATMLGNPGTRPAPTTAWATPIAPCTSIRRPASTGAGPWTSWAELGTDNTDDEEASAPAIRAHLAELDQA